MEGLEKLHLLGSFPLSPWLSFAPSLGGGQNGVVASSLGRGEERDVFDSLAPT